MRTSLTTPPEPTALFRSERRIDMSPLTLCITVTWSTSNARKHTARRDRRNVQLQQGRAGMHATAGKQRGRRDLLALRAAFDRDRETTLLRA